MSGRCAINQLSLLMQRAMLRSTKVETGLGKLSPFATKFFLVYSSRPIASDEGGWGNHDELEKARA